MDTCDVEILVNRLTPLSFRDQCAIAAMNALIVSPDDETNTRSKCARRAFDYADAMEAERKKRNE